MLWVLSAVIGLLIGAVGAWTIQASARKRDAALAEADLKVAQARTQMLEDSLAEQKEARKAEVEAMRREYDEKLQKMVLTFKDSASAILKEKSVDLSAAKVGDVVWCSDNRIWSVSIVRKGMNGSSPTLAVTDAAKGERYTFKLATNGRVTSDDTERRVPDYVRGVVESVLKQMRRVSKGSRR